MENLARAIEAQKVGEGCLAIYWLSQAGFVFKTSSGKIIYVDPYYSDVVERIHGFKRMMACPIAADEVVADLIVCTHEHLDHMDTDALPTVAKKSRAHFAGLMECFREFKKMGIPDERCHLLEVGKQVVHDSIRVTAVFADHGELAPDAVGVVLELDGVMVYHTGDTAYHPRGFQEAINMRPDVFIPCINGRYGNLNAEEAALLTREVNPRLAIASHFWMFIEHNGDPASFLEQCAKVAPQVQAIVMKPGERYLFRPLGCMD